jgi:multisubunit Na+/H+ antiporter MnhB subunit
MKNTLIKKVAITSSLALTVLIPATAQAAQPSMPFAQVNVFKTACEDPANSNQPICKDRENNLREILNQISTVMLFILGAIAVIMIIIGGIRYVTSGGDPQQTKAAKDTVLYAVIGLIVALLAYAIVRFIVDVFVPSGTS